MQSWEENQSCKRRRLSKETNLSQLVYDFFRQVRAKSIPITGGLLKAKAANYTSSLHIEGFKATNGWLGSWKERYNVKRFKRCGEGADVDEEVVNNYKTRIPNIVSGKNVKEVFNCGLFYRAMPDKTLAEKGDAVIGGKMAKERLTVLLCCNASGEKLKPLVIGKAWKPHAFSGVNVS